MDKPAFEEVYPEVVERIRTHSQRQRIQGYELDDVRAEMAAVAWACYKNWDPKRLSFTVWWWCCWTHRRYRLSTIANSKGKSHVVVIPMSEFAARALETGDVDELPEIIDDLRTEDLDESIPPCPMDASPHKDMWLLWAWGFKPTEVRKVVRINRSSYDRKRLEFQRVLRDSQEWADSARR